MGTEIPRVWLTDHEIELIRTALTVFEMTYLNEDTESILASIQVLRGKLAAAT
jgi:hypothetical protein